MAAITHINLHLIRVRCNNPSVMTGSGTNTYIVHNSQEAWVIDPGPNTDEHVQNIFKSCEGLVITKSVRDPYAPRSLPSSCANY